MNKQITAQITIQKTLMTARLFDGFWDRWVAHGLPLEEVQAVKDSLTSLDAWIKAFSNLATKHFLKAAKYEETGLLNQAEDSYRLAGLYYNLIHWIYPDCSKEKIEWYKIANQLTAKADRVSDIRCLSESIEIDGLSFVGRIRVPENTKGCIIIVNPIDSSKEELYSYEKQFIDGNYITISFDGPGQGETFAVNGLRASRDRWEIFLNKMIDFTANKFPGQDIHLFGTSSGAAWSVFGSSNPLVQRVVAVSPPVEGDSAIPNYFGDRIFFIVEDGETVIPSLQDTSKYASILLFHGNKDVMVHDHDMHRFYEQLPSPKEFIEYPDEGHCCNFKLGEVRDLSMKWFKGVKS